MALSHTSNGVAEMQWCSIFF
ncbi:hypothetical protein MZD92_11530 [Escherichia coli]|nr:hypothetical protein [Escherichia coli]MCK2379960.1 hypothetical protein [Escherichia coli]